jgi:hypothetical protein
MKENYQIKNARTNVDFFLNSSGDAYGILSGFVIEI